MRGGVADTIALVLDGLTKAGHEVRVFAPQLSGAVPDRRVERMPAFSFAGGAGTIVSPFGIKKRLAAYAPDVVHLHSVGILAISAGRAARTLGIPLIITYHGDMSDYLHVVGLDFAWLRRFVDRFCTRYFNDATVVTAPSRLGLKKLRAHGVTRPTMEYVHNPIHSERFRPADRAASKSAIGIAGKTVGIFGRISREKNLPDAVAAIAAVSKQLDITCIVIGDGPYRMEFEKLIHNAGLKQKMRALGFLGGTQLVQAINACDVMLSTGLAEVQPLAILQSLACGVPVIGTNAGGTPECIQDGADGFIVEPHDIPGYTRRLMELLLDDAKRSAFGAAALNAAAAFSPESVCTQYERVYKSAITQS